MEPFEQTSRMPTGMDHYTNQGVTNYQAGQRSITPSGKEMVFEVVRIKHAIYQILCTIFLIKVYNKTIL